MSEKCMIAPERDCPNATKIALLEQRVGDIESAQKRENDFRKAYYEERDKRNQREARLDEKINGMDQKLDKVVRYQEAQQAKPGNFLDKLKDNSAWLILAAVLGAMLMRLGLKV